MSEATMPGYELEMAASRQWLADQFKGVRDAMAAEERMRTPMAVDEPGVVEEPPQLRPVD